MILSKKALPKGGGLRKKYIKGDGHIGGACRTVSSNLLPTMRSLNDNYSIKYCSHTSD